jgi:hypothetical protein
MRVFVTLHRHLWITSVGLVALLIAGCGDSSGLAKRYPVRGTVTYNGASLPEGTIAFKPASADDPNARAASGVIKDGRYELTTATEGDGALPGKYAVTISARQADFSKAQANVKGGGSMRQDDVAKAYKNAKKLIPAKYELPETSGLTYEVKQQTNQADFALTD